jgi:hypothetical protein
MAWTKAKTAMVGVGVLLFVGTTMVVVKLRASAAYKRDPVAYKVLHERSPQNEVELRGQMVGVWELVAFKSRQANKLIYLPPNNNNLKIFSETNWSISSRDADSNVIYSAGGPYTLKGNVYTETIETATGQMTQYLHMRPRFRIRVDGDKYYQMGVNQSPLEEIWQRVPQ